MKCEKSKISSYKFAKIYELYLQKIERKGRNKIELNEVIRWLTGFEETGLQAQIDGDNDLGGFFDEAPQINPNADKIKGVVCGVGVEEIDDPLTRKIRLLDKLADELAKGKAIEKILRC